MKPGKNFSSVFHKDQAASHDEQFAKLAPMKDALHLFTRIVLADLPQDAHILCVGVGTGAELFDLAAHNPQWRFTVVDPAAPMLDVCRRGANTRGIALRCTFHEGYLISLDRRDNFDAATCFLVSHFLIKTGERHALFAEIASRLLPKGILVSADIAGDRAAPEFEALLSIWLRMLRYTGLPDDNVEKMRASLGVNVAVLPPKEVEEIIKASGFCEPILIFQSILIHAWFSRLGAQTLERLTVFCTWQVGQFNWAATFG